MKISIKKIIASAIVLVGIVGGYFFARITIGEKTLTIETKVQSEFNLELGDQAMPAKIETADGTIEIIEVPTVESVETNNIIDCPEGEECGVGKYIYAPVDTPIAFKDYTINKCWNTDGYYGAQCWDLGDMFWQNYAGRNLSTCGTGIAKGIWNCKEQNAGDQFELITDVHNIQLGDWIIFSSGKYGHVGMAMGSYNNGYVTLLGQNQGGKSCEGGGSATNIININLSSFMGAFRPKTYIKPEPQPQPEPIPYTKCVQRHVYKGDTMSKIMLECENTVVYGEAMDAYAKTWFSMKYKPNQSVYDGWHSATGVGLYAGDDIEHRVK